MRSAYAVRIRADVLNLTVSLAVYCFRLDLFKTPNAGHSLPSIRHIYKACSGPDAIGPICLATIECARSILFRR